MYSIYVNFLVCFSETIKLKTLVQNFVSKNMKCLICISPQTANQSPSRVINTDDYLHYLYTKFWSTYQSIASVSESSSIDSVSCSYSVKPRHHTVRMAIKQTISVLRKRIPCLMNCRQLRQKICRKISLLLLIISNKNC